MALVEPPELAPSSQLVIYTELEAAEAEQDHRHEEDDGTSEFPTLHRRALSASSINSSTSRRDVMQQHGTAAGSGGPSSLSVGVAGRGNAPVSRGISLSPSPSPAAAAVGSSGDAQGSAAPPPASLSHLSAEAAGARLTAPRSVSPRPASPLDAQPPQPQQIDKLLLEGLRVSKDRILILKSDLEIEKFVEDAQRSRMRCIPPAFPPALNSYQRLLIHRLADMWGVTRELESPPSPGYAQQGHVPAQGGIAAAQNGASSLSSNGPPGGVGGFAAPSHAPAAHSTSKSSVIDGIIVLVKTERTRHPSVRISSLVPPMPVPASAISPISLIRQPQSHPSPSMSSSVAPSLPGSIAGSSVGSLGSPRLAAQQDEQSELSSATSPTSQAGPIRIMARASNGSASGSRRNSPVARGAAGQNTALTFEEREAAYQEARLRIFNQSSAGPSSASTYPAQQVQPQPYMAASAPQVDLPMSMSAPPADLPVYAYQAYPPSQSSNAMVIPPTQEAYTQQNSNALRPSAPTFMYQPVPVSTPGQGQGQPQQYAYYAVPVPVQGGQQMAYQQGMQHLAPHELPPPIQITMSSPAMQYAQHLPPPNFASATPSASLLDGEPASVSGHVATQAAQPRSRPQPTRSHSSRSSISTTTSTSSIRTASTSSAVQRLNSSLGSVPISPLSDLRPMRQTSSASSSAAGSGSRPPGRQSKDHKPVQGQQRPALTNLGGSANSAASETSRHSRSSSSVSTSTGTSVSGSLSVLSAGGRSTGTTSGSTRSRSQDKGKGREREAASLPEAHPSLPAKPILNLESGHSSTSSDAADRSADSDSQQLLEGDETEMDGEGEGPGDDERLAEAVVRTVTLDDVLESKKEKRISSSLTPPAAPSSAASDAGSSSIAPSESASQRPTKSSKRNAAQAAAQDSTHANPRSTPLSAAIQQQQQQHSQQQPAQAQQKIVEYPPLRYDREKGWTALHPTPGGTVVSLPQPSISRGPSPAPGGLQRKTSRGKGYRPGATPPAGPAYMMPQGPAAMHLPVHPQQQQQQQQQHAIYFTTQPPHQRQGSSQEYTAPHQLQYIPAMQQAVSPGEAPGSSYQPPPQFFYAQPYQPSFDGSGGQGQPQHSHPHQQFQLVAQQPVHYAMPGQQMHASHIYPGQSSSSNGQQYIAVPAQYAPVPGNPPQQPEYFVQQPYYYQPQPQMQMMAPASSAPQPMLHQPDHERQQSRSPRPAHQQQGQPYPLYAASAPPQPLPGQPTYHVYPMGGMTQADLVASGEMLYSYDIPRPVPRSGATLFDPNARAATT